MICARPLLGLLLAVVAGAAFSASKEVQYVEVPGWVAPAPAPTTTPTPAGAPLRIIHSDMQIYLGPDGDEQYSAARMKLLTPEALAAGNVTVKWSPDAGDVRVHYLRILRDGKVIDVLKDTRFEVLRREGFLENAALNGELTATLQVPGLQVGDELEFAETVRHKDVTLGDHSFGFAGLGAVGQPGAFRVRLVWPQTRQIKWQATKDVPALAVTAKGGNKEIIYELRDPAMAVTAKGAPTRVNLRRLIEYSDFDSWKDVSARLWPLFDKASVLPKDSPVRAEVSRIAASTKDPIARMEAALQLVQERIRYVYVGMDGANFTPATINDTWERRFGDCKAKTVLLLAILKELGIEAQPVMVNLAGGDGMNERLPTPGAFNHVLVRVHGDSATYWLDGTRPADKSLAAIPDPPFRWVLPLKSGGADLESVPTVVPTAPYSISVLEFDASAGFKEKAAVKAQQVFRGDDAFQLRSTLVGLSKADADRSLKRYWEQSLDGMEPDTTTWSYDERQGVLRIAATGKAPLEWKESNGGQYVYLHGAGFTPPAQYLRAKEEDQSAPWANDFPSYNCYATSIKLPVVAGWRWDYSSSPMNLRMGGVTYWRLSDLRDNTIKTVMSKRYDTPEITAAQAEEVNKKLPTFDNNMSQVFQIGGTRVPKEHPLMQEPPFTPETDWTSLTTPCGEGKNFR